MAGRRGTRVLDSIGWGVALAWFLQPIAASRGLDSLFRAALICAVSP
jgi:hypothetical protein